MFKPTGEVAPGHGPAAPRRRQRLGLGARLERDRSTPPTASSTLADEAGRPVALLATAEAAEPVAGAGRRRRDHASASTRCRRGPWAADYARACVPALDDGRQAQRASAASAWLSDGARRRRRRRPSPRCLATDVNGPIVVYADTGADLMGLKPPVGARRRADRAGDPPRRARCRPPGSSAPRDIKGRVIGDAPFTFAAGETTTEAKFTLPVELRNEIVRARDRPAPTPPARCSFSTTAGAGAASGCSPAPRSRRRSRCSRRSTTSRAPSQPFADVREPRDANAAVAVPDLIDAGARSSPWPTSAT